MNENVVLTHIDKTCKTIIVWFGLSRNQSIGREHSPHKQNAHLK